MNRVHFSRVHGPYLLIFQISENITSKFAVNGVMLTIVSQNKQHGWLMFEQQSSLLKEKYFFTYGFQHLLQPLGEMQEALRTSAIYGAEGMKNSS